MLAIFLYLSGILESDKKRTLAIYGTLSILTPALDLFSISMLVPIINQAVNISSSSEILIGIILGMAFLTIFKGGFELYKCRLLNGMIYDGAYQLSTKLYEVLTTKA